MPGKDKTGPEGKGPMTGGRRGACRDNEETSAPGRGLGRGAFGRGRAGGRGRGPGRGRGNCAGWRRTNERNNND